MSDSLVQRVRRDPNVVVVEADAYYQHTGTNVTVVDDYSSDDALPELNKISKRGWSRQTQADAPWHLASISGTKVGTTQGPYDYISNAGEGVYVYVLDSGVFIDHPDFEGRAVHFKGRETSPVRTTCNNICVMSLQSLVGAQWQ